MKKVMKSISKAALKAITTIVTVLSLLTLFLLGITAIGYVWKGTTVYLGTDFKAGMLVGVWLAVCFELSSKIRKLLTNKIGKTANEILD